MSDAVFLASIVAHQWNCDHFGHLNSRHYAAAFDDALFIFWRRMGAQMPAVGEPGSIPVTAEMKTIFAAETVAGTVADLRGRVIRVGGKSVALKLEMTDAMTGHLLASCDVVEVFFDMQERQSRPIPDGLRGRLLQYCQPAA